MTPGALILVVASQFCLVGGNLMLKQSMDSTHQIPVPWRRVTSRLSLGIALLALWFFLWLGLLGSWDLSQLFPFEGLSPILVLLAARLFLGEPISKTSLAGIVLTGAGIALVAAS